MSSVIQPKPSGRIFFCRDLRSLRRDAGFRKQWREGLPWTAWRVNAKRALPAGLDSFPRMFHFHLSVLEQNAALLEESMRACALAVEAAHQGGRFVIEIDTGGVDEYACREEFVYRAGHGYRHLALATPSGGLRHHISWTLGGWV